MENEKQPVDFRNMPRNCYFETKGWMAADATMSDRVCDKCGRFSNSNTASGCPYCGFTTFRALTIPDGRRCCLVEGSFYLFLTKGTEDQWHKDLATYTKYLVPKYGFKLRSVEENGILSLPVDYLRLKKGALIHLSIMNHPWDCLPFEYSDDPTKTRWPGRDGVNQIFKIRPNYGDTFKILKEAEVKKVMNATATSMEAAQKTAIDTMNPEDLKRLFLSIGQKLGLSVGNVPAPAPAQHAATAVQEDDVNVFVPDPFDMW